MSTHVVTKVPLQMMLDSRLKSVDLDGVIDPEHGIEYFGTAHRDSATRHRRARSGRRAGVLLLVHRPEASARDIPRADVSRRGLRRLPADALAAPAKGHHVARPMSTHHSFRSTLHETEGTNDLFRMLQERARMRANARKEVVLINDVGDLEFWSPELGGAWCNTTRGYSTTSRDGHPLAEVLRAIEAATGFVVKEE